MEPRALTTPLNTATLQKTYPEIYREFFSSCDFVFSAPATFLWAGDIADRFGGTGCAQKVPRRVYVGLKLNAYPQEQGIHFAESLIYHQSQWERQSITEIMELTPLLEKYILVRLPQLKGSLIRYLYEFSPGIGLNAAIALGAAFALAMKCLTDQSSELTILKENSVLAGPIKEPVLIQMLQQIYQLRCILTKRVGGNFSSAIESLVSSPFPLVVTQKIYPNILEEPFNQSKHFEDLPQPASTRFPIGRFSQSYGSRFLRCSA